MKYKSQGAGRHEKATGYLAADGSAEEALRKISDRNYAGKYTDYSRRHGLALHTVGISFSSEGRCIEDWKEEMIVPGRE